jgi:signal transduction histidine kinase/ligand-binding sensor domain-containing protein
VRGVPFHLLLLFSGLFCRAQEDRALRDPVHPRLNVEEFPPVETARVRFTVMATLFGEPCLDELEIYGPEHPEQNLALTSSGTVATASGTLPDYRIHLLEHINDGHYGNAWSWISDSTGAGWVELRFPRTVRISRILWSRDREGKFTDRLANKYRIEAATESGEWRTLASSDDRAPVEIVLRDNPVNANSIRRIAPAASAREGASRKPVGEYVVKTWQTPDGLPSNTVTALLAAADGWLWVGTTQGIVRFDGAGFRYLGEAEGLSALNITCLIQDAAGALWAGTAGGGAARWDGAKFHPHQTGSDQAGNTVLTMTVDAAGRLWAGNSQRLLAWNGVSFEKHAELPATRLAATADGMWIVSHHVLRKWSGTAFVEEPAALDPSRFSALTALAAGRDGALWFGGANEYVGRYKDGAVKVIGKGHAALFSSAWELLPTADGDVWVGTSGSGLGRIRGTEILQITTDDGLPSNTITALCEDPEGNLWAGSSGGGLSRLSPRRVVSVSIADGLSHNAITALAEDAAGALWIGTNGGGLNRLKQGKAAPFAPSFSMENKCFAALCTMRSGEVWAGTLDAGLFRIAGEKVTGYGRTAGLPSASVTALCEAPDGGLWIGTLDGGAARFDGTTITPAVDALAGLPVTAILVDDSGGTWFATAGHGVARLAGETLTRWTRQDGLASDFVSTLSTGRDGSVWAGTKGGLARWKDGQLFAFDPSHGLPDSVISQILDDGSGHLWLGTNRGIVRVALASLAAVASGRAKIIESFTLGTGDGLPSLECTGGSHPSALRLRDGRLCFGTAAGLAILDPKLLLRPAAAPQAIIETPSVPQLALDPGDPRLEAHFTAVHFTAPERVRFRYRLAGLETKWTDPGSVRHAVYPHLPPGDYQLEVAASTEDLVWSAQPAVLRLKVPPVWWRSPFFVVPAALALLAAVIGGVRYLTRLRLKRRLTALGQQVALERERTRIARDIHDDLGTHLTQISLLSALGQQHVTDPDAATERFSAISATATDLGQKLDAIVWAVNPRHDTLESLARYLTRYAGDVCGRFGRRLRLNVPTDLPEITLSSDQRHNLFLAVKEALHNALHHSGTPEVRLSLAAAADRLSVTIADDGSGISPEAAGTGEGLHNMRQRLADSGGACHISTSPGGGTSVHFTLPLSSQPAKS